MGEGAVTLFMTQPLWPGDIFPELDDTDVIRPGVEYCGCGESQGVLQNGDRGGCWGAPGVGESGIAGEGYSVAHHPYSSKASYSGGSV